MKLNFKFYSYTLKLLLAICLLNSVEPFCYETSYSSLVYFPSETLLIRNFNKFSDIYSNCFISNLSTVKHVLIHPQKSLIIDESFNLQKIFSLEQEQNLTDVTLANIKGFNINRKNLSETKFLLGLTHSVFNFYSNEMLNDECNSNF